MNRSKNLMAIAVATLFFGACQKEAKLSRKANDIDADAKIKIANSDETGVGHVYTLSNQISGNDVIDFRRSPDGRLTFLGAFNTGGNGNGAGLGNQGAVILVNGNRMVLAVNAGSNSISSLEVTPFGLSLKSTVNSGGIQPVSLTQHQDIVFVLNAGGVSNISGFLLDSEGILHPIPNSTRPLSAGNVGPAQIEFVNEGKVLVITEKATNIITSYTVNGVGIPGTMHTLVSANPTPFGFAVGQLGNIFVSEAVGGAPGASTLSSYHIDLDGMITLIDGPVGAGQGAACWVVLTNNGKFAYVTNTASGNLTTFSVNVSSGDIGVFDAISATTPAGPIDAAMSNNSKFLYVLNSVGNSISVFAVAGNGDLSSVQTVPDLPPGANGLAAK